MAVGRVSRNVTWNLTAGGGNADSETSFLLKMCSVVERLLEQECGVLRQLSRDVPCAAVAKHYVNVLVANAALRTHAAVHHLVQSTVPQPDDAPADHLLTQCRSAVSQLSGDPTCDLQALAEVRRILTKCGNHIQCWTKMTSKNAYRPTYMN